MGKRALTHSGSQGEADRGTAGGTLERGLNCLSGPPDVGTLAVTLHDPLLEVAARPLEDGGRADEVGYVELEVGGRAAEPLDGCFE